MTPPASNTGKSRSRGGQAHPPAASSPVAGAEAGGVDRDDRELLAQIAAGQEDALRSLYAAYRPRLWRFVYERACGDSELTNTVLQDVFLSVWQSAASYRGHSSVATWLFGIARHVAGSARRGRRGRQYNWQFISAGDSDGEEEIRDRNQPDWAQQALVERLSIYEAFAGLSPKYRDVVDLVFRHGFTYEEAGHILSIPIGTVKSRLSAARQMLAKALTEYEE